MNVPFVRLEGRARWAVIFLGAVIVCHLLAIAVNLEQIAAINRYLSEGLDPGSLSTSDDHQSLVDFLRAVTLLGAGIAFIRWFHAAYRNVTVLAPKRLEFTPGWAIGAWFVPILCLWRPKQIADLIRKIGERQPPPAVEPSSRMGTSTLVTLWWALWVIGEVVGNTSARFIFGRHTLTAIRSSDKVAIGASLVDIAAAVLAILVVQRLTARLAGANPPAKDDAETRLEPGLAAT